MPSNCKFQLHFVLRYVVSFDWLVRHRSGQHIDDGSHVSQQAEDMSVSSSAVNSDDNF